jgi:hypothetical protein
MTEDRSAGREEFVTRVLAASERARTEAGGCDWYLYQGATYKIEVSKLSGEKVQIVGWNADGDSAVCMTYEDASMEHAARFVWEALEVQRTARLARELNPRARCDGGNVSCKAPALWAFKVNPEDGWMYACGRHLTWSITEELGGEQGELTVRRIATEER